MFLSLLRELRPNGINFPDNQTLYPKVKIDL